jgi:fumarate hydratase, class I
MQMIYELDVKDMPVSLAVSAVGTSVHSTEPKERQVMIGKTPLAMA